MLTLRKGGHRDLERYYGLMEVDFDSEELIGKLALHRAISKGDAELLIAYDDETRIEGAYALVFPRSLYGCVLVKYLAVFPWFRGRGVGVELMRLLNRRYADRQCLLAEITEFADPEPDHVRKVVRFFSRFGYSELDCDWRIAGTKAHLFVKPVKGSAEALAGVYRRVLADFYSRVLSPAAMSRMFSSSAPS